MVQWVETKYTSKNKRYWHRLAEINGSSGTVGEADADAVKCTYAERVSDKC
jgi:hypothetical protein